VVRGCICAPTTEINSCPCGQLSAAGSGGCGVLVWLAEMDVGWRWFDGCLWIAGTPANQALAGPYSCQGNSAMRRVLSVVLLFVASALVGDDHLPDTTDPIEVRVAFYGLLAEASDETVAEHYATLKADRDRIAGLLDAFGFGTVSILPHTDRPVEMRRRLYDLIAQSGDGELVGYYRVMREGRARGVSSTRIEARLKKWQEWRSDPDNEKAAAAIERLLLDECMRKNALHNEALLREFEQ